MFQDMKGLSEGAIPSKNKSKILFKDMKAKPRTSYSSQNMYSDGSIDITWTVCIGEESICKILVLRRSPKNGIEIDAIPADVYQSQESADTFYKLHKSEIDKLAKKELEAFANTLPIQPK